MGNPSVQRMENYREDKSMRKYFIGNKICDHYAVYIMEDGYEEKVMVQEDDLDGFIQCLEHFGYH